MPRYCAITRTRKIASQTRSQALFQHDRFHQVSRPIHVEPFPDRHIVSEQLQWNYLENWRQQLWRLRDENGVIGKLLHFGIAFCSDCDHLRGLLLESADVGDALFVA